MNKVSDESRISNIKDNIHMLMKVYNISNLTELAKLLNIPPTTIYSFYKNPLSNSKAKTKICEFFNINIEELELTQIKREEDLYDKINLSNDVAFDDNNIKILSMSDAEIANVIDSIETDDEDIISLKNNISKSFRSMYKKSTGQARIDFNSGNYQRALYAITAAFWMLTPDELKLIDRNDLLLYIKLAKHYKDENLLVNLIQKLSSIDFYNEKIMSILAKLLINDFKDEAKICLEIIEQERNQ